MSSNSGLDPQPHPHGEPQLVQGLGLMALIATTFNCTVGGGIFRLPVSVYQIAGRNSPWVYVICFLIMSLVATVFIQVGKTIRLSGGPYAYVQPVLGPYAAFICGVLLWALATFAMAAVGAAYAGFVTAGIPSLSTPGGRALILGITLLALIAFNKRGVKTGAFLSIVLSVLKILPMLIFVGVGASQFDSAGLTVPTAADWNSLSRASIVLVFAFTGVESALIPSGEIKNPERNLPRALYFSMILVLVLYLGIQLVTQSILGDSMGATFTADQSPLALAAQKIMGTPGALLLGWGAVLSTLGYLSAITLTLPRSLYVFARDGYLPRALSKIDPITHAPTPAIWTQASIAFALAISSWFEKLAVLSNVSALLMYAICAVAAFCSGKKVVPTVSILLMLALLMAVSWDEWLSVLGLLVVATAIYRLKASPKGPSPKRAEHNPR